MRQLRLGDIVAFNVKGDIYKYKVRAAHLNIISINSLSKNGNGTILEALKIENKEKFATANYGYAARGGDFPECTEYDYKALTAIATDLQNMCNEVNKICDVGAIVVRTMDRVSINIGTASDHQGYIFKALEFSHKRSYYKYGYSIEYWRYATKIERDLFNSEAITNVNDISSEANFGKVSNSRTLNHSVC